MILDELNKASDKWAMGSQPGIAVANVQALGASSESYTIQFKNGNKVSNVSGPSGLSVGNAVTVANYPGKTKKYAILQKTSGSGIQSPTVVSV
jgi:hypothetical protein